nr:ATP-binding protein [Mucilaginibacter sp. L294]
MSPLRQNILLMILCAVLFLSSCGNKDTYNNSQIIKQINVADSLILENKYDTANKILQDVRNQVQQNDPVITSYYQLKAEEAVSRPAEMSLYTDSAMAFFANPQMAKKYPDQYAKILLLRGDVSLLKKQYSAALDYYYRGKKSLTAGSCDNGILASKIAGIYYLQKNYKLAARNWAENYKRLSNCDIRFTIPKLFYLRQGALNNAALAYQKANMQDSALVYFKLNTNLLASTEKAGIVDPNHIATARVVLYDNLGGAYLSQKNYNTALIYLNKSINTNINIINGVKIPPNIKLAQIYLETGNYAKANEALKQSRLYLDKYRKDNLEYEIQWYKFYAEYLFKLNQPVSAYQYQKKYVGLKDSVAATTSNIYRVNIDRELDIFHQQQALSELKHQDKLNQIYLLCITIAVVLSVIIILLINRNLNTSKKNHRFTEDHNRRLQQTLVELEAANKNYIRIMRVMAHDLRNPLAGITGLTALLLEEEEDFNEENRHILGLIESTGINSIEMINELLKSGLADENEALVMQPVDVKALLHDSVKLLQFKANEKDQQIIFENNGQPIIAHVSQEKIWRVFNNLIVNAIKFSYKGSKIEIDIALTTDKKKIKIAVTDHGIGIPDKDKGHIFDMFTTAKKPGTNGEEPFGLGLSITKKIVDQHHGKIWFTSQPGDTTFYVTLPNYQA